jgi:hypothetical protein
MTATKHHNKGGRLDDFLKAIAVGDAELDKGESVTYNRNVLEDITRDAHERARSMRK